MNPLQTKALQNSMWTYPWDVLDLGPDRVVEEITQQAGVGGISLAAVYHAGRFLQPRSPKRHVYFPEDGTVYFHVTPSAYERIRIQPKVASLLERGDALRMLQERAEKKGFRLNAWVVGLHNTRIGMAYPDVTVQNAFGDHYYYNLCPSQPDARQYVTTLLRDLTTHYELSAVELESFNYMGYYHEFHHEKDGVGLTERDQFLMSLCFCDRCKQEARKQGVPIDLAQATVRRWLEESLNRPVPAPDPGFSRQGLEQFGSHPEVFEYLQWRAGVVTSLIQEIRDAVPVRTNVYFLSLLTPQQSWLFGVDFSAIAKVADGIVVCCYDSSPTQVEADMKASVDQVKGPGFCGHGAGHKGPEAQEGADTRKRVFTGLRVFYPEVHDGQELAEKVSGAVRAGSDGFVFYNYGLIPAPRLRWVKDSLDRAQKA